MAKAKNHKIGKGNSAETLRKSRVLIVGPVPPPYMGPSLATQILLRSDLCRNFDLDHLDTSHHKNLKTLGVISWQNILAALRHSIRLFLKILRNPPDIVYIPISQSTIGYLRDSIFILIAKFLGRKVICHLRGGFFRQWLDAASLPVRRYVSVVHSLVDAQIVLGKCLRHIFAGLVPENSIYVVPNGRDFDWSPSRDERQNHKPIRILYLGNMIKTKGVLDVLRATPIVKDTECDVEFFFAGAWFDDAVKAQMEAFARREGNDFIKLLGTVVGQQKFDLLQKVDIFVFPTYYPFEGHPWVIVEAMAAGLPIITTNHGAIVESVAEGVNGFIVEKENPAQIAAKLLQLCRDDKLRRRMGKASRNLYEEKFTEAAMVKGLTEVFNGVISE